MAARRPSVFVFIEDRPPVIAAQSRRQRVARSNRFACAPLPARKAQFMRLCGVEVSHRNRRAHKAPRIHSTRGNRLGSLVASSLETVARSCPTATIEPARVGPLLVRIAPASTALRDATAG